MAETKTYKTCSKCNIEKTLDKFSKDSSTKDKLERRCKECVKKVKQNKDRKRQPYEKDLIETDITNLDWQGGKLSGSFSENNNSFSVRINKKTKTFNINNFTNKEECLKAAKEYRQNISDELKLIKNKYKIIFKNNQPKYLIVQLSKNYITLCDYNQLDLIKNHNIFVSKGGGEKSKQYCMYQNGDKTYRFHGKVSGFDMVDHIDKQKKMNYKIIYFLSL